MNKKKQIKEDEKVREEERLKKVYIFFFKKVNFKKIYRKIGNKKDIYIYIC